MFDTKVSMFYPLLTVYILFDLKKKYFHVRNILNSKTYKTKRTLTGSINRGWFMENRGWFMCNSEF